MNVPSRGWGPDEPREDLADQVVGGEQEAPAEQDARAASETADGDAAPAGDAVDVGAETDPTETAASRRRRRHAVAAAGGVAIALGVLGFSLGLDARGSETAEPVPPIGHLDLDPAPSSTSTSSSQTSVPPSVPTTTIDRPPVTTPAAGPVEEEEDEEGELADDGPCVPDQALLAKLRFDWSRYRDQLQTAMSYARAQGQDAYVQELAAKLTTGSADTEAATEAILACDEATWFFG